MMRIPGFLLVLVPLLAACGGGTAASGEVDRSSAESVAVGMITSVLNSDYDGLRELIVPDQREDVDDMELAASLAGPTPEVEIVSVAATVVSTAGDTAIVDYSAEYCLPAKSSDVPVTVLDADGGAMETVPGGDIRVEEPEQCFSLDEIFQTSGVEFRRIDGQWYAPLPE